MAKFIEVALSFPTLAFSIVLAFCVLYWLLVGLGLAELDLDLDIGLDTPELGDVDGLAGILGRLGLDHLPMMLVVTVVGFFGWFFSYFAQLLLPWMFTGWLRWLVGSGIVFAAFVIAVFLSAAVLRPVRRWLLARQAQAEKTLLGEIAVVRTPTVNAETGMADVDDGGAGLILQVRADPAAGIQRGDRVVLMEFDAAAHVYRVIPESRYRSL